LFRRLATGKFLEMAGRSEKQEYFKRIKDLMSKHSKVLVVGADNVSSKQCQQIRMDLRGKAILLFGKNTMMRKALREMKEDLPKIDNLVDLLVGNVGLIFTNNDLKEIRDVVNKHTKPAVAKIGAISQLKIVIPAGPTGLEPTQINFLQALNIATKIVKGQIEIMADVNLVSENEKINSSQAALLLKLNLKPFSYGLRIKQIYEDGDAYEPSVLDIQESTILHSFSEGIANIAAVSLSTGVPSLAAVPHGLRSGIRNVLAVSLATSYTVKEVADLKKLLSDPEAMAKAAAAAAASAAPASSAAPAAAAAAAAAPAPVEEEEEEEMEFDLFG